MTAAYDKTAPLIRGIVLFSSGYLEPQSCALPAAPPPTGNECYGADIYEVSPWSGTLQDCLDGCRNYAGDRAPCLFVTCCGRCIYKNGATSQHNCTSPGCDAEGYCLNTQSCDPTTNDFCGWNVDAPTVACLKTTFWRKRANAKVDA
eukprot:gene15228-biopygen14250